MTTFNMDEITSSLQDFEANIADGIMRILPFCIYFSLSCAGFAQDAANKNGFCFQAISGTAEGLSRADNEIIVQKCFADVLDHCSVQLTFTSCVERANSTILLALSEAHENFDKSSLLEEKLPIRRNEWGRFEGMLEEIRNMQAQNADDHINQWRMSLFAAVTINGLR